jgi:tRNA/tmRNA/rRNA uracil-C5-methylase (TrmA/RlmC/RlmD family)
MEAFSSIFARYLARGHPGQPSLPRDSCISASRRLCFLCHASTIDYDWEKEARNAALAEFWSRASIGAPLARLVDSAPGREYRTISKRKAFQIRDGARLGLIEPVGQRRQGPMDVLRCYIEPEEHAHVYRCVQEALLKPITRPIASSLRYVVVKGSGPELLVILNVTDFNGPLVRAANTLSKTITRSSRSVKGVWLYRDSTRGSYYLGTSNPSARNIARKLFGKGELHQTLGGKRFLCPVFSFSQVNVSLVDRMISSAKELLQPEGAAAFFDLYCGYGVFTLTVGESARESVGVERSPESIQAAVANAARQGATRVRFLRSEITGTSLRVVASRMREGDRVLLDPPRGGTAPGVIERLALAQPGKVVHLFCSVDGMPDELSRWRKAGYRVVKGIPFDMFPGTDETEVMVLLQPA